MNTLIPKTLILAVTLMIAACGDSNTPTNEAQTPDGEIKKTDGKGDAWDWRNNPERFKVM